APTSPIPGRVPGPPPDPAPGPPRPAPGALRPRRLRTPACPAPLGFGCRIALVRRRSRGIVRPVQPRRSNILIVSVAALLAAAGAGAQEAHEAPGAAASQSPGLDADAPSEPDPETFGAGEGRPQPPQERRIALEVTIAPWYPAPGGRYFLPGETRGGRD